MQATLEPPETTTQDQYPTFPPGENTKMKNEWADEAPITFIDDEGKTLTLDQAAEIYQKQRQEQHEANKKQGYIEREKLVLAANEPWDSKSFEEETERQADEFREFAADRDRKEKDRIESENGLGWMAAHPEFIPSKQNSDNITRWLSQHNLPGTVENIEKAYHAVKPILQLKPQAPRPVKVYTSEELYEMPMDELEALGGQGEQW